VKGKKTYTITFTFTVDEHADPQLHTTKGIRDEIRAWLEGLDAKVTGLRVEERKR
jgi:hypothetical protein